MRHSKYFIALALIVALAVAAIGCGDNGTVAPPSTSSNPGVTGTTNPPPPTTPTPEAMLKSMTTASVGMNTFESKMLVKMDMTFLGTTMKIDMNTSMTVDVPGKKFYMDLTGQTVGFGETVSMVQQMYVVNDTLYIKMNDPESGLDPNAWYKTAITAVEQQEMWTSQDVGDQFQILLDAATLQILGSEAVNGVQCYKVKVTPNMDKFMAYLAASGSDIADMGITNAAQAFKQLDITFWVDKANYLPIKMDMTMNVDAQGVVVAMTFNTSFEKVNQPVTITLPAAAQAALPLPE